MDQHQQAKYSKPADILDLSVVSSADDSRKNQGAALSEEEWRIRGELESEIERDLEEEIKDGIYHLAFRLHRLYEHKRERNGEDISESGDKEKDKTLSEVKISIKMEGGTKVEIKETKKEAPSRSKNVNTVKAKLGSKPNGKKFDWAKSLRAGTDPAIVNIKNERSYEAKAPNNGRGFCKNRNVENTRRNLVRATGSVLRKGSIGVNNKVLEQGWKW